VHSDDTDVRCRSVVGASDRFTQLLNDGIHDHGVNVLSRLEVEDREQLLRNRHQVCRNQSNSKFLSGLSGATAVRSNGPTGVDKGAQGVQPPPNRQAKIFFS